MRAIDFVQKAFPGLSQDEADYLLWNRTPFPFDGRPRTIYRSIAGSIRAAKNGIQLCETCWRPAVDGWNCETCNDALRGGK